MEKMYRLRLLDYAPRINLKRNYIVEKIVSLETFGLFVKNLPKHDFIKDFLSLRLLNYASRIHL